MNLQLPLKKEWFEMTSTGIKTEDYREINDYWFSRLVFQHEKVFQYCTGVSWAALHQSVRSLDVQKIARDKASMFGFKPFDTNTVTLGYPKFSFGNKRILTYEHKGIEIATGNPEWGADPGKLYFVIKHGNLIP